MPAVIAPVVMSLLPTKRTVLVPAPIVSMVCAFAAPVPLPSMVRVSTPVAVMARPSNTLVAAAVLAMVTLSLVPVPADATAIVPPAAAAKFSVEATAESKVTVLPPVPALRFTVSMPAWILEVVR